MQRLAAAAVAIALLATAPDASAQPAQQPIPVEARTVGTAPIVDSVRAVGTLRAEQSIIVRPEVPGVITKINFAESTRVKAGHPLFTLDQTMARAEVQQAGAALTLAQRNHERAVELARTGAGTQRGRDEALAAFEAAKGVLALARARLEKTVINAAFGGIVGLRRVDLGAYVTAGQDLVSLDAIDVVIADFTVPERYLRFLAPGRAIEIEVDALPGRTFTGEITALSPRIDPDGRSLAVRARVPNGDAALRPGLFARVGVITDRRDQAIVVPEQAIVPRGDRFFVYRVVDGRAALTAVKLGLRSFGRVEIVEGLAAGESIITAGQLKVQDGSAVRLLAPATGG